jgi:hypothetical protein
MASSATAANTYLPHAKMPDHLWRRTASNWIRQAAQGHLNNTGTVTLGTNTFSTSVTDTRVSIHCVIDFMPQTANAAAERKYMRVTTQTDGRFVVTHRSSAMTDKTFTFVVLG